MSIKKLKRKYSRMSQKDLSLEFHRYNRMVNETSSSAADVIRLELIAAELDKREGAQYAV